MICCCDKCKFVFESVRIMKNCPDCGSGTVRKATALESSEYAANRLEFGPMKIYGQIPAIPNRNEAASGTG